MKQIGTESRFNATILTHLDSAYNLANWLTRNEQDAQDVVQEAMLRAFKAFDGFRGGDARAWLLTIVRNTCFSWMRANRGLGESIDDAPEAVAEGCEYDPALIAVKAADVKLVRAAIEQLPLALREAMVLREMEGLSYKEVAKIIGVPMGTVMSRLSRGREKMYELLLQSREEL